jgi:hypothetical protein
LSVSNPRCEYSNDPVGVDAANPHLSWELKSDLRNVLQTAYRILVADDPALLNNQTGNIWDSKKVNSSASIQVKFVGKAITIGKKILLESNGMG